MPLMPGSNTGWDPISARLAEEKARERAESKADSGTMLSMALNAAKLVGGIIASAATMGAATPVAAEAGMGLAKDVQGMDSGPVAPSGLPIGQSQTSMLPPMSRRESSGPFTLLPQNNDNDQSSLYRRMALQRYMR